MDYIRNPFLASQEYWQEFTAQLIYNEMPFDGIGEKPEWVQRGNSLKQDEARQYARVFLETFGNWLPIKKEL